jgi:hypothetical protein
LAVVLLLLVIFVVAGYFLVVPKSRSAMMQEYQYQRDLWDKRVPAAFRYFVDPECACPPEYEEHYVVVEENGSTVARFEGPTDTSEYSRNAIPPDVLSIDAAFELIRQGINEAGHIEIDYDGSYGFPTDVTIYWSEVGADDFFGFEVYNFEVIQN